MSLRFADTARHWGLAAESGSVSSGIVRLNDRSGVAGRTAWGRELATDSFGSGRSVATLSAASVRARERLLSSDVGLCLEVRERPVIGVDRSLNRKIAAVAFGSGA